MRELLLDTNVLSDLFASDPDAVDAFQNARRLCINTVVLAEMLSGILLGSRRELNTRRLSAFLSSPRVSVLEIGRRTAEHYADISVNLRRKGRLIPTNDLWIAASAREHGLVLLTRDGHFRAVEGLLTASSADELFFY